MESLKTVKCKLIVDEELADTILATLFSFSSACNFILNIAKENEIRNKYKLQRICYREFRERYNLHANMAIRAIARVAQACKKYKPFVFRPTSIDLDTRLFSFLEEKEQVSIALIGGRYKLKLALGKYQRTLLAGSKPTAAVLSYDKHRKVFSIHIAVNRELPIVAETGTSIGIDRGIYNLATTSRGLKFSGRQALHIRKRYSRLRQSLQKKGTKGAKRLLIRLAGKEQRVMRSINHSISKALVQSCSPGDTLVMENLKYIRERMKLAKKQKYLQHSWAFGQLGDFIEYKAIERGISVIAVDPRHTSQRCSQCSYVSRGNRSKHLFFVLYVVIELMLILMLLSISDRYTLIRCLMSCVVNQLLSRLDLQALDFSHGSLTIHQSPPFPFLNPVLPDILKALYISGPLGQF